MKEGQPITVQYVFLDIVGFTKNRTIEAQVDIIKKLNQIINKTLKEFKLDDDKKTILLPTGDGVCIAIIMQHNKFSLPLDVSLHLLKELSKYNKSTKDKKRKFEVRIGVNQNIDNIIIDINKNHNVAGRGINTTQRIMSFADGNQILVGSTIYDILCEREAYVDSFKQFNGHDKHGNTVDTYQFIKKNNSGLNIDTPTVFQVKKNLPKKTEKLTLYEAHMITNSIKYHDFFIKQKEDSFFEDCSLILLHFLAHDSMVSLYSNKYKKPTTFVKFDKADLPSITYNEIKDSHIWVRHELAKSIQTSLKTIKKCFEGDISSSIVFTTKFGQEKLREDHPSIFNNVVLEQEK